MKKLNFSELKKLADDNQQPRSNVYIAAFIQSYIGELERLLKILMGVVAMVPLLAFYGVVSGELHWIVAVCLTAMSVGVGATLFIEHLYCSKGTSFLGNVTGLARALCPDKTWIHKSGELDLTMKKIADTNQN